MAPVAIAAAYFGGWVFALFWAIAALAILWEWTALVSGPNNRTAFLVGAVALAVATLILQRGRPAAAILIVVCGAVAAAIFVQSDKRLWTGGGVVYAGAMLMAPVVLRADSDFGFLAMVFLFLIVWATDVFGYFAGRMIGGPKLAPAISPKKTWSGAIAGTLGAATVGVVVAIQAGLGGVAGLGGIVLVVLVLSIVSQGGDLLESAIKRRFDAKDAGHLIPGHGGVMDRLDGFWAAAVAAALIGYARGGLEASGRGLMVW